MPRFARIIVPGSPRHAAPPGDRRQLLSAERGEAHRCFTARGNARARVIGRDGRGPD
jgi:hypothetical protein